MILGIPIYRLVIFAVAVLFFGSVLTKIKWHNLPKIAQAISQQYPGATASPAPRFEATEERRTRLKSEALAAGKAVIANACNAEAAQRYRDTLIALARQRMRDMGCNTDMFCDVEKGFKEVSFRLYATDVDRQISRGLSAAMKAGAIGPGELGVYQLFVGHPQELATTMNTIALIQAGKPCPINQPVK